MKIAKIMPLAILCLLITTTIVTASHTSSVSITPNAWARNSLKSVSISVTNNGPDNINTVELVVPKDSNQVPLYKIGDITTPQGWTYTKTDSNGYISRITWIALGSGIASGNSLNLFGIDATSPATSGNYQWSWTTTDINKGTFTGSLTTNVGQAPVSYFVISGVPSSTTSGNSFKISVRAFGDDNQVKADYTGKITFTSTDISAVLPSDYTFQPSDYGSKEFTITYKTIGEQKFVVSDATAGVSKDSIKTIVNPGPATDIGIMPQNKAVSVGDKVVFTITAKDALGNLFDVTSKSTLTIDKKAGGSWNKSTYTAQNEGTWIVIASYNSMVSGTTLIVGKTTTTTVVTPTEQINITPNVPSGAPEEVPELSLTVPESTTVSPGANETLIVTVNNNGNQDATGVEVMVSGVPSDWINIYPLLNDVPAKSSKDYLVIVFVPANESGSKTIMFSAKSSEGANAESNTSLVISSAPTGTFALPKNLLQLGVVIIAVAAVVIIGWELWFKKPKSK